MSMKTLALLAATLVSLPTLAQAEERANLQTTGVNWNLFAPSPELAAAAQPGGGAGGGFALPVFIKGGLWTAEGTGFFVGGGVGAWRGCLRRRVAGRTLRLGRSALRRRTLRLRRTTTSRL